ncbi:hypothetical protein CEXT_804771 [Caerostris extrusa]|uniref:Uncharacterized protein n=1 Tax=Caerostris extrusa TaxID=172846 RepID=A0AAV4RMT9_CAEEX|nr:hypothetical protein CEXT_804771 [Caerostris extrusa]
MNLTSSIFIGRASESCLVRNQARATELQIPVFCAEKATPEKKENPSWQCSTPTSRARHLKGPFPGVILPSPSPEQSVSYKSINVYFGSAYSDTSPSPPFPLGCRQQP